MGANSVGRSRKIAPSLFFAGMILGIVSGCLANWIVILVFLLSYCISYYQLPLWVMSFIAMVTAKAPDLDSPSDVFAYLRTSSLYWDSWEILPLPDLKKMMQLAIGQDIKQAMQIMDLIHEERPLQFEAALHLTSLKI